ncbi:MAG: hypothetical protein SGI77_16035 [Pirellulaceae bacterium]|nr:hypothetical protein [Pirellulaceae bacterium]
MQKSLTRNLVLAIVSLTFALRPTLIRGQAVQELVRVASADDLAKIISEGDDLKLIEHLKNKADPNGQTSEGVSLLLKAWQTRHRRCFDILLEFGADPHQILSKNFTLKVDEHELALPSGTPVAFIAMQYAYLRPEFFELVLRYLKRPDQRNPKQETILHAFISSHRVRMDQGRKLCNNNPLNYGLDGLAQVLILNAGVDINATDADGRSALDMTIPHEPASPEFLNTYTQTKRSLIDEVMDRSGGWFLSSRGANPYIKSNDGSSYVDNRKRFEESYKEFHNIGNYKDFLNSRTRRDGIENNKLDSEEKLPYPVVPLKVRAEEQPRFGHDFFMSMFFDEMSNEISVSVQVGRGMPYQLNPPPSSSVRLREARAFDELVNIGFEPNTVGIGGFSFLWGALMSAKKVEFDQLIQMGASPDMKLTENLWDCGTLIRKYDAKLKAMGIVFEYQFWPDKGDSVLMAACLNPFRRKQFIEPSLAATKDPNQRDDLGRNLLHLLLYHPLLEGQEIFVEKLIQAGVDVNAQTIGGATPAHVAVGMNPGVIPTLVQAGADLQIRDMRDRTVLDLLNLAIAENWGSKNECKRVLNVLISKNRQ